MPKSNYFTIAFGGALPEMTEEKNTLSVMVRKIFLYHLAQKNMVQAT